MQLILVRHGKAFERDAAAWPDDSRRPLTAEGRRAFARFARALGRACGAVDMLESSGFSRAWTTAQLLHEHAGWPRPSRLERLELHEGADADPAAQLESLRRTVAALRGVGTVAWVGHEPVLSRLASLLLAGSPDAVAIDFKKGAALSLAIDPRGDAVRARLGWMLTPGAVRRAAKRAR